MTSIDKVLKSIEAKTKSTVHFFNKSSLNVVTVWLDYNGKPVKYTAIPPGENYTQSTYVTHPWIVVEMDSGHFTLMLQNSWAVFFPQESEVNVDITSPEQVTLQDCLAPTYHDILS